MPQTIKPPLPTRSLIASRQLRRQATDAESELWLHLRARRLGGFKFRRQHPFPPYAVDFYCAQAALALELDGSRHCAEVDATRAAKLERQRLLVLRFWNHDVLMRTEAVLGAILSAAEGRTLSPTPLPSGEGLAWTFHE